MVIKKNILSKEEGREAFIEKIKLLGINDKDSLKNLSKFYNLCWAKVYEGNDRENTNVLFECNSQEAGEAVLSVIENTLVEQGIFKNSEIGTRFLKKQEDVDVVIQILRDEKLYSNYKTVIVACYKEEYAKNNKEVLNAVQLLKDADGNNGIFQRKLSIHININIDSADIYTSEVMTRLERVRKCTDEFKEGIRKYIHNLPSKEEREVKDDEAFITDIENRVFQFYYSQDNLGEMFDENCIPHYETVEEDVENEVLKTEKSLKADLEQNNAKSSIFENLTDNKVIDLNEYKDKNEIENIDDVKNVLILGMSTLPYKTPLTQNSYEYGCNGIKIYGYGQLDPIPQLLNEEILEEKLDLIIITATSATLNQYNKSVSYEEDSELCKEDCSGKTVNFKCSAVELFKYHMMNKFGDNIKFKTIKIDDDEVDSSIYTLTNFIRGLYKSKENSQKRLYMDVHGGPRINQTLLDAAITVLGIEDIEIEKVFTCEFEERKTGEEEKKEKVNKIKDVTDQFQIFKFVSGIDDFINHGSSYEIKNYVDKCCDDNQHNREELVKAIQKISDALILCKVTGFETALDNLKETIENGNKNDFMFRMLVDIIKSDYGKLIEKDRSLYDEIKWAVEKDLYQQVLTLIEAKTPQYVFKELLDLNTLKFKKESSDDWLLYEANSDNKSYLEILTQHKPYSQPIETKLTEAMAYNCCNDLENDDGKIKFKISNKGNEYKIEIGKVSEFNIVRFKRLLIKWNNIKSEIRNAVAHSSDESLRTIVKGAYKKDTKGDLLYVDYLKNQPGLIDVSKEVLAYLFLLKNISNSDYITEDEIKLYAKELTIADIERKKSNSKQYKKKEENNEILRRFNDNNRYNNKKKNDDIEFEDILKDKLKKDCNYIVENHNYVDIKDFIKQLLLEEVNSYILKLINQRGDSGINMPDLGKEIKSKYPEIYDECIKPLLKYLKENINQVDVKNQIVKIK